MIKLKGLPIALCLLTKQMTTQQQFVNTNSTYKYLPNTNKETLTLTYLNFILKNFQEEVNEENQCLPSINWIPKVHKNPCKTRLILAAPKYSLKPLSKPITSAFKLIYKQIEPYNKQGTFVSGTKFFWTILNNESVINSTNNRNNRGKATFTTCFDFLTLCNIITHDK